MPALLLALLLSGGSIAAETPTSSPPSPPAGVRVPVGDAPSPDPAALARARGAIEALGRSLKTELVTTMKTQGPVAALGRCSLHAPALTAAVAQEQGVAVGRSSLRLRNPANAGPSWVTDWLQAQGERPADGVQEWVQGATRPDGTPVVRVIEPLAIEAPCLVCHGPTADRSPKLSQQLAARYPDDQATGYALGDLRGAIWAEAE